MATAYVDIGNTSIVVWVDDANHRPIQWAVNKKERSLHTVFNMAMDAWVVSSVVPSISNMIQTWAIPNCQILSIDDFSFLSICMEDQQTIGVDRLVNATGAIHLYGDGPLIIVDIGTAITCCYIDENRSYCGGMILPGFHMVRNALHEHTEQLPRIAFPETVPKLIGGSTKAAIESGLFFGSMAMVNGVLAQYIHAHPKAKIILTGGIPTHVLNHINHTVFEPNLPYEGMKWLHQQRLNITG